MRKTKKKDNNTNTRNNFRGYRNLILYNNINKLILKTDCDSENKTKCLNNSDNSSNIDYILKLFFFRSYSVYYFRISEIVFGGVRRRRFD